MTARGFTMHMGQNFARDGDFDEARPRTYADLEARMNDRQFKSQERNLHRNARNTMKIEEAMHRFPPP
jgi:hypothetical protein